MAIIGGTLGYRILRRVGGHGGKRRCGGDAYLRRNKLETLLGPNVWDEIRGRTVIDFGCGEGAEAVELAKRGAASVTGIDIRENVLERARAAAAAAGVADRCTFTTATTGRADVIISIDAFEHFADPAAVLRAMRDMVTPDGCVLASFGPPWLHPLGGHLFSVFPWAHLVFTEGALIRWRSDFKTDGATRFGEVEGGLNQMTITRFHRLVEESPFRFATFEPVPIRRVRWLHNPVTREFFTSVVRCKLVPRTP
jgi:SAM-dependent methyltransferase